MGRDRTEKPRERVHRKKAEKAQRVEQREKRKKIRDGEEGEGEKDSDQCPTKIPNASYDHCLPLPTGQTAPPRRHGPRSFLHDSLAPTVGLSAVNYRHITCPLVSTPGFKDYPAPASTRESGNQGQRAN